MFAGLWPSDPLRRVAIIGVAAVGSMVLFATTMPTAEDRLAAHAPMLTPAEAWAANMAQLGIRPIYPPTEDFHVGDIWAVVVLPDQQPGPLVPLLSRGARISHRDLRSEILAAAQRRPVFSSEAIPFDAKMPRPNRLEATARPENERIPLAVIGFPSVERRVTEQLSAGIGAAIGRLTGSSTVTYIEQISVPHAVGYGIDPATGAVLLAEWCFETRETCNRTHLGRVLQFALGPDAVPSDAKISLVLVNYVFATQSMEFKRQRDDDRALAVSANGVAAPSGPPESQQQATSNASGINGSARSGRSDAYSATRVFERPVAIGFRAVSLIVP